MDRGAWWAIVHRVAKNWAGLKQLSLHDWIAKSVSYSLKFPMGLGASLVVQWVENLAAVWETGV